MAQMSMIQAINSALDIMLDVDPSVVIIGEDVGYFGGVFRCTEGLHKKYGEHRVIDAPIAEGGIEHLVLARPLLRKVFGAEDLKIVDRFKGRKLKGRRYHPLFTFLLPKKPAHLVVLQDYVGSELGTGLVHVAPAFNAEDLRTARVIPADERPSEED